MKVQAVDYNLDVMECKMIKIIEIFQERKRKVEKEFETLDWIYLFFLKEENVTWDKEQLFCVFTNCLLVYMNKIEVANSQNKF